MTPSHILEQRHPGLAASNWSITSPATREYNCVAWAAGINSDWWWPDINNVFHWPAGALRERTLPAFESAFQTLGYTLCPDGALQSGMEKIAIFARDGLPTHVARQLPDGRWTSKCGRAEDISHDLAALEGDAYGHVALFMERPRATSAIKLP